VPTSHERITRGLDHLTAGLSPFIEREMRAVYHDAWQSVARESFRDDRAAGRTGNVRWDAHALLTVMWDQWNRVFRFKLGQAERSLVSELRDFRNRWAHQARFTFDDAYRMLDSVERLLRASGATEADTVAREKRDVMRHEFSSETRAAYQKSQANRKRWQDIFLYGACCSSVVFALLESLGPQAWFLAVVVIVVFAFLGWHRATSTQPVLFGAHECVLCGKIIYGDACPYCEPGARSERKRRKTDSDAVPELTLVEMPGR
jgi:hypothetical protein